MFTIRFQKPCSRSSGDVVLSDGVTRFPVINLKGKFASKEIAEKWLEENGWKRMTAQGPLNPLYHLWEKEPVWPQWQWIARVQGIEDLD